MKISLQNLGKRYNREWIFRNCNYEFILGKRYAITGSNGSGKSTLLQVIAGAVIHNEGEIKYSDTRDRNSTEQSKEIAAEKFYQYISIAAPYLELVEEMTALEMLEFHRALKPLNASYTNLQVLEMVGLHSAANKQLRYFSSGMKQRLKLALAFFSDAPVLLLDEPTTNLDADGIALYQGLLENHAHNKLVIISSNDPMEYKGCEAILEMGSYKTFIAQT